MSERELRNQILVSERARTVAEDASKLKDEFLATMSHEIRTPLNAVLGWTQILRTQSNVQSRERALEVIERNASSQLRLVEDLLDMARIISGKLRLDVRSIDLKAVVQAALDVIEPGAVAKQVAIETRFDESAIPVNADADRLQQAIWNVLSNALKFTGPGGTIRVTVTSEVSTATVVVADTGQGISADFLPYVFDRFRQADASTSRRHGGLGLGLALTRQIVELHGGSIGAESDGPNKGAEFSIRLPVADALSHVATSIKPKLDEHSLRGTTVLIVDDSADSREMFEAALAAYGATVVSLDSSEQALTALEAGTLRPDVLLSDIGMPDIDGYDLIRQRSRSVRAYLFHAGDRDNCLRRARGSHPSTVGGIPASPREADRTGLACRIHPRVTKSNARVRAEGGGIVAAGPSGHAIEHHCLRPQIRPGRSVGECPCIRVDFGSGQV